MDVMTEAGIRARPSVIASDSEPAYVWSIRPSYQSFKSTFQHGVPLEAARAGCATAQSRAIDANPAQTEALRSEVTGTKAWADWRRGVKIARRA